MRSKQFISILAEYSEFNKIVKPERLSKLQRRLAECNCFAKYSQDVTPEHLAYLIIMGLILPTIKNPGANAWIKEYQRRLNRTEDKHSWNDKVKVTPVKTTFHALVEIFEGENLDKIEYIKIDLIEGKSEVKYNGAPFIDWLYGVHQNANWHAEEVEKCVKIPNRVLRRLHSLINT